VPKYQLARRNEQGILNNSFIPVQTFDIPSNPPMDPENTNSLGRASHPTDELFNFSSIVRNFLEYSRFSEVEFFFAEFYIIANSPS